MNAADESVELRGYITHRIGDEVLWQIVDGRKGESVQTLYKRTEGAMWASRGIMSKGMAVESSFVVQQRTVTPWVVVDTEETR